MLQEKKIGLVINSIDCGGGAERVSSMLVSRFAEMGYETHLICIFHSPWEFPINNDVKRHFLYNDKSSFRFFSVMKRLLMLRKICRKENIDVLIGFMTMAEYSVIATWGLKTRSVISVRNDPNTLYPSRFKRFFARMVLSMADGAVFQTEDAKEWFPGRLQRKSKVIFNPVDNRFYQVKRAIQPRLLVASGRLHPQKNYPMMLKALAVVLETNNVLLEIYGKGALLPELQEMVNQLGISDKVRFCGQSDDIPSVLSKADAFLLSSDYEGLPNGLMEAMAVGVPIVSTDCPCGGPKMLLGENERGLLVPVGDAKSMASAIKLLLDSPQLKEQVSANAKIYARQFSVDNCFDVWCEYVKTFIV